MKLGEWILEQVKTRKVLTKDMVLDEYFGLGDKPTTEKYNSAFASYSRTMKRLRERGLVTESKAIIAINQNDNINIATKQDASRRVRRPWIHSQENEEN